jgi:hypothetical protein
VKLTIGFGTSKGWVAWLKHFLLRDEVTHVWLEYFTEDFGQEVVIHASVGGVQLQPKTHLLKKYKVQSRWVTTVDVPGGYATAIEAIDTKYDYPALLFGVIMLYLYRWFRIEVKNIFASPDAVICSELVVMCDPTGKIPEWRDLDPERVSPQMLLDICRKSDWFEEVSA